MGKGRGKNERNGKLLCVGGNWERIGWDGMREKLERGDVMRREF